MIYKFSLIAEFEYDDENGEYAVPSPNDLERAIRYELTDGSFRKYDLKLIHSEVANGTLSQAFDIPEVQ